MDLDNLLNLMSHGNQLKRTLRSGWVMRGVPDAENVAAHSHGVAMIVLLLGTTLNEDESDEVTIDLERALSMAVIHDLQEAVTTDIPRPAWGMMPPETKAAAEANALEHILALDDGRFGAALRPLFDALQAKACPESRLVKDADNLDMYLQAAQYETAYGNRALAEFWTSRPRFFYPLSEALYDKILEKRKL